jgi:hypothetical protein
MTTRVAIENTLPPTPHSTPANPSSPIDFIADGIPLARESNRLIRWIGPVFSLLVLIAVAWELRRTDLAGLLNLLPRHPVFWLCFAGYYLAVPISEWMIFRRLWRLPAEGFGALLRKMICNEILLGYLGEVYFYAWARRNAHITTAPFAVIKDVAVLSALVGNLVTLVMVVVAAPLLGALHLGTDGLAFVASAVVVLLSSLAMLLLRKRLFALPRPKLWFVGLAHLARIAAMTLLAAVMWHLLLPSVGLSWWLLLGTLRQLLSRLPFLPNKEVVFAGLASFLVGSETQIVAAMTLIASLVVGMHLLLGAGLGVAELARESRS